MRRKSSPARTDSVDLPGRGLRARGFLARTRHASPDLPHCDRLHGGRRSSLSRTPDIHSLPSGRVESSADATLRLGTVCEHQLNAAGLSSSANPFRMASSLVEPNRLAPTSCGLRASSRSPGSITAATRAASLATFCTCAHRLGNENRRFADKSRAQSASSSSTTRHYGSLRHRIPTKFSGGSRRTKRLSANSGPGPG